MRRICFPVLGCVGAVALSGQNLLQAPQLLLEPNTETAGAADLDGDGDLDLVRVSVDVRGWLNDGRGRFTPGGSQPRLPGRVVAVGDFTGDGRADAVGYEGQTVFWYPGDGAGGFAPAVTMAIPGFVAGLRLGRAEPNGGNAVAVIVSSQYFGWIVRDAQGVPVLRLGPALPPFQSHSYLLAFDADGDGDDDLAASTAGGVRWSATVNGVPGPAILVGAANQSVAPITALDVENDGDLDLLVCNGRYPFLDLQVLRNSAGVFVAELPWTRQDVDFVDPHAGDWDGDGDTDVYLRHARTHVLLRNDGSGGLSSGFSVAVHEVGTSEGGLADLDGDGHLDFFGPTSLVFGDAEDRWSLSTAGNRHLPVFDVEGDGDPDMVDFGGAILANDGRGQFTARPLLLPAPPPGHAYVAGPSGDFDGNGFLDMVTPLFDVRGGYPILVAVRLMADDGSRRAVDRGDAITPARSVSSGLVIDLDGDGDLDFTSDERVSVSAWWNDGSGRFAGPTPVVSGYQVMDAADVDADGDVDLLAGHFQYGSAMPALLRHGSGRTFTVENLLPVASLSSNSLAKFADIDGDGDKDVLAKTVSNQLVLAIFVNNSGGFAPPLQVSTSSGLDDASLDVGDIDGDGDLDVVAGGHESTVNRLWILPRVGSGLVFGPPVCYRGLGPFRGLFDIDGDGDLDVHGQGTTANRAFHGDAAGGRRQYGDAGPGTGGVVGVLGVDGPLRPGLASTLRVRHTRGNAFGQLVIGLQESNLRNVPFPGLDLYAFPWAVAIRVFMPGSPLPGSGSLDVPLPPAPAAFAGARLYLQLLVGDPGAATGIAHSNGLELRWGR